MLYDLRTLKEATDIAKMTAGLMSILQEIEQKVQEEGGVRCHKRRKNGVSLSNLELGELFSLCSDRDIPTQGKSQIDRSCCENLA